LLFVINHTVPGQPREGHSIELFAIAEGQLRHLESIANLLFRSPNDIAAVGPRQFYVTNDRGYLDGIALQLERIFGWANSDVVYFDGQVASVVLDGLTFANGIQFAPRTERIFITETRANTLHIYRRSRDDGALTFANRTQVGRGPDNIDIDENGNIWIATHPKAFKLRAHADRPESLSPSRVVRLRADGTGLEEIYVGTGEEFSAASVAAVYNGEMLLGTIFDAKLLRCRLPD
jgi:arylesterase/paraoxonase